jgi:hypothetical protein
MRKRFLVVALVCLFSFSVHATTAISGNLLDIKTNIVTSRAFVRFELVNCVSGAPRLFGAGSLPMKYVDFRPNTSGVISGTVYSNSEIDCGGSTATRYRVTIYYDGTNAFPSQDFLINGASWSLNTATVYNPPVVPVPPNPIFGIRLRGAWTALNSYVPYDAVSYGGGSYVALTDSTAVTPGTDATKWMLLADQGDTGPTGETGPAGSGTTDTNAVHLSGDETVAGTKTFTNGVNRVVALDKGFVNAVTDCSVPSDRTSDIAATLNACILANPGKRILLPRLLSAAYGQDYYSSARIDLKGLGTTLVGGGACSTWSSEMVTIQFASGTAGIRRDTDNTGGGIECISVLGGDAFVSTTRSTYEDFDAEADFQGTTGFDGVQILAKGHLKFVEATSFKRHGFLFNGNAGGQPDLASNIGVRAAANRAYGVYTYGSDANVGLYMSVNCWFNGLGCNKDSAFYGNTWMVPHSSGNARFPTTAAGSNKAITAATGLSVTSNILTISTDVANTWAINDWVTTTGSTDATFNGTCKLTGVATSIATCPFTHANGSTGGGTAALSSMAQISAYYTAKSIKYGSYVSTSTAGCGLYLAPYTESTSGIPDWGCALVIGSQGVGSFATGFNIFTDTSSNLWMRGNGVVIVPSSASGKYFEITETTGATATFAVDMNVGSLQTAGKIRVRSPLSIFGAFNDGLELPNGLTSGVAFRNNAGSANVRAMYLDTSDVVQMPATSGYNFASAVAVVGNNKATTFSTTTNCSSTGGTCSAASAGSVGIPAAATTVTVSTTAVTANSQIFVQEDSSLGTKLGVTCNTTTGRTYTITARTAATSFVITASAAPVANPACLSFRILN